MDEELISLIVPDEPVALGFVEILDRSAVLQRWVLLSTISSWPRDRGVR
jgi:hypothetical protein